MLNLRRNAYFVKSTLPVYNIVNFNWIGCVGVYREFRCTWDFYTVFEKHINLDFSLGSFTVPSLCWRDFFWESWDCTASRPGCTPRIMFFSRFRREHDDVEIYARRFRRPSDNNARGHGSDTKSETKRSGDRTPATLVFVTRQKRTRTPATRSRAINYHGHGRCSCAGICNARGVHPYTRSGVKRRLYTISSPISLIDLCISWPHL